MRKLLNFDEGQIELELVIKNGKILIEETILHNINMDDSVQEFLDEYLELGNSFINDRILLKHVEDNMEERGYFTMKEDIENMSNDSPFKKLFIDDRSRQEIIMEEALYLMERILSAHYKNER